MNTPPRGLNKSGMAFWFSLNHLIANYECYLWTLTFPDVIPDFAAGERHRVLLYKLSHDARAGRSPALCGVRVVEAHPGGHGLHYHWVLAGRYPVRRLLARGRESGFGRISVDSRPCTPLVAPYLCKYLLKGDRLHGVRMWANIGAWQGVGTRDIEVDSGSIRVFRDNFRHARFMGKSRSVAFNYAKVKQREYDTSQTTERDVEGSAFDSLTGRVLRENEPF